MGRKSFDELLKESKSGSTRTAGNSSSKRKSFDQLLKESKARSNNSNPPVSTTQNKNKNVSTRKPAITSPTANQSTKRTVPNILTAEGREAEINQAKVSATKPSFYEGGKTSADIILESNPQKGKSKYEKITEEYRENKAKAESAAKTNSEPPKAKIDVQGRNFQRGSSDPSRYIELIAQDEEYIKSMSALEEMKDDDLLAFASTANKINHNDRLDAEDAHQIRSIGEKYGLTDRQVRKLAYQVMNDEKYNPYVKQYNNLSTEDKKMLDDIYHLNAKMFLDKEPTKGQELGREASVDPDAWAIFDNKRKLEQKYGKDAVNAFIQLNKQDKGKQFDKMIDEQAEKSVTFGEGVLGSAASVPLNVIGGMMSPIALVDAYINTKKNQNYGLPSDGSLDTSGSLYALTKLSNTARQNVTNSVDWNVNVPFFGETDVFDFLYNTGMSGIDSMTAALTGNVGIASLSGTAALNSSVETAKKGATAEQSLITAMGAAAYEYIFEKISLSNLNGWKEVDVKKIPDLLKNLAKSIGVNASEESLTETANMVTDFVVNQDKSDFMLSIKSYENQGYSRSEAVKMAALDGAKRITEAGLSGALMGFGFSAVGSTTNYAKNRSVYNKIGKEIKSEGLTDAVVEAARTSEDEVVQEYVQTINQKGKDKASNADIGMVAQELMKGGETTKSALDTISSYTRKGKLSETQLDEYTKATVNAPKIKVGGKELTLDGKNFDSKTESFGEFKGISENASGEKIIETTDGTQIKLSEAVENMTDETAKALYKATEGMTTAQANLFISEFNGETIDEYKKAADYYYKLGSAGLTAERIAESDSGWGEYLTEQAQNSFANLGASERELKIGLVDMTVKKKTLSEKIQLYALNEIAKTFGNEIMVVDDIAGINGAFRENTNRIIIGRNSDQGLMTAVFGHESFHEVENYNPEAASELIDFTIKALEKEGVDIDAEIQKLRERGYTEERYTRDQVLSEIAANNMYEVFSNEAVIKEYALKNHKVLSALVKVVDKAVKAINTVLGRYQNSSADSSMLIKDKEALATIRTKMLKAMEEAKANREYAQAEQTEKNTSEEVDDVLFSVKRFTLTESDIHKNMLLVGSMDNVVDLSGNEFAKGSVGLPDQVDAFFAKYNYSIANPDIGDVEMNRRGAKDSIAHGIGRIKAASFAAVPYTIEKGKIIDYQKNWKGRQYDTIVLAAPISINSERYYQGVIVIRDVSTQRFYLHEVLTEKESDTSFKTGAGAKHTPGDVSPSLISLLENVRDVNKNVDDTVFSTKRDADYMTAVESGDTETAQRMVDEAAKNAGYNSPMLYHGTQSFGFTEFDLSRMDDKRSIFLTSNNKIASTYSGVGGTRKVSASYSKDIDGMKLEKVTDELNALSDEYYKGALDYRKYTYIDTKYSNELISTVNDGIDALQKNVSSIVNQYKDDGKIYQQLFALNDKLKRYEYQNLSTPIYMLLHHTDVFAENGKEIAELEKNIRLLNEIRFLDVSEGYVVRDMLDGYSLDLLDETEARDELKFLSSKGNYSMYAKSENPLVIDGKGQLWRDIRNWHESVYYQKENTEVGENDEFYYLIDKRTGEELEDGGIMKNVFSQGMTKAELHNFMLNKANQMLRIQTEGIYTTREIAKFAKERGYDSVVFKNILDNGGMNSDVGMGEKADIYVYFSPNQLKSADPVTYDDKGDVIPLSQRFDDSKDDIRWSIKSDSSIQAHYAEVARENRNLKEIINLFDEQGFSSVRGKVELSSERINLIAKSLLKNYSSKYDANTFADEIKAVYDYMANAEELNTDDVLKGLLEVSNRVLEQSGKKDTELWEQYKDVRDYLRTQPILITENVKKEIIGTYGSYKSYRNLLMGKVNRLSTTNTDAMTLDEVWQELSEMAPEFFSKDTNELDMPLELAAFYDAIAPQIVNPYEINLEDAAVLLSTDILSEYENNIRLNTTDQKYKNLLWENKRKMTEHRKALEADFKKKKAENKQEQIDNYKKRVIEFRQQKEAGERRRVLRNTIERNYNYLNRRLTKETDREHIPEEYKPLVSAFKDIIPDKASYFSKTKFISFVNEYRKLEGVSVFFDEDMPQKIENLAARLTPAQGAPKMRELDIGELNALQELTEHVKHIVKQENTLFSDRLKGQITSYAQAAHSEMQNKGESRIQGTTDNSTLGDKTRHSVDSFIKGLTKPEYLFESLGSKTLKKLYDEIRRGENIEARIISDAREKELEIKKANNYDTRWEHQTVSIKFLSGELNITVEQLMSLYASSKRHQSREHMLNGGVIIHTQKQNGKRLINKRERFYFKEQDILTIEKALTADQKNYVNAMVEYITKDIGAKRNEISMRLLGIEKYKEEYYFPIKVDKHFLDSNLGKVEVVSTIKNQGSSKRVTQKAHNPIEIGGFTDTVNDHIYDSALYCAYVLPVEDFRRVYNYRDKVSVGEGVESLIMRDISIKEDIRRTKGINAIKEIENFMVALDSGSRYENVIPLSAKLAARAKKTSVMANLSVVVQQPTAVFRSMLYVNPKYFATVASKSDIAEMKKWNGCALKKEIGYFDVNMGRTATDFIGEYHTDKTIKKDWNAKDHLKNIKGSTMQTIDEVAGWGASKADEITWGAIWKACKKQVKAENKSLIGDELNVQAAELFQKVITKTQVYDSVFTKPEYMRRKEGFSMMATQFMSEPLTSLNMLAESVAKAKNAPKNSAEKSAALKHCTRAFACYLTSIVVNAACKSIIYTIRDDDEDKSFLEKYVANVFEGIATDPIGMIPYVKDILSLVQGYDLNRIDVAAFSSFKEAIDSLGSDNKTPFDKIMSVLKAAGQASGIPFYSVMRDGKALLNTFNSIVDGIQNGFEPTTSKGIINELQEVFDWVPFVDAESNYEQLYNSLVEGDTEHYDKVYENLIEEGKGEKAITSNIVKQLKDAYSEGSITETELKSYLYKYKDDDEDENDIFWKVEEIKAGDEYEKYGKLYNAVDNGAGFDSVISYYTSHGVEITTVRSNITKKYKPKLTELPKGSSAYNEMYDNVIDALVATGKTESEAIKQVNKWFDE